VPVVGEKLAIEGGPITVKLLTVSAALVPVPPAVVTATRPVVAPTGTVAVICVSLLTT